MTDIWASNGGLFFGYGTEELQGRDPPLVDELRYADDRHVVTVGPNGSGKSKLLLHNLALLKDWSCVVVDPKGDLAQQVARHRDPTLENSIFLNPFGVAGIPSNGFNPVAALDPSSDDFPDDVLGLAEALIRVEGREPHWAASAQDLIAALIMYSRLTQPDGGSLIHVREMLGRAYEQFRELVANMIIIAEKHDCDELAIKAGRYLEIDAESRELNSILSTALTQTRWLDSRPIKSDLETKFIEGEPPKRPWFIPPGPDATEPVKVFRPQIDFGVLKKKPTSIYLILPARRLGTHSVWIRLLLASIIQPLMKDTTPAKVGTLLMIDESYAIFRGGFPIIEDNMAMFRGHDLKLWTVLQDLSQAEKLWGRGWETFVANAGVLQSFAPQDVMTAEYLSKRTGLAPLSVVSRNKGQTLAASPTASHGGSVSEQGLALLLPQHLRDMGAGYAVIFTHKAKGTVYAYLPFYMKEFAHLYLPATVRR